MTRRGRIAILGRGRAGSALAKLLRRAGWRIVPIAARRAADKPRGVQLAPSGVANATPAADILILAVPDRALPEVVASLVAAGRGARKHPRAATRARRPIALHVSGAQGASVLGPLRAAGWAIGSLHPLVAFPPRGAPPPDLTGTVMVHDGDLAAVRAARMLARSLGARPFALPERARGRYHLAACLASNYAIALFAEGTRLLVSIGFSRREASRALLPLLKTAVAGLERTGLPDALTGPVARGDVATVRTHARALRGAPRALRQLHVQLVRSAAHLAREAGTLQKSDVARLERALRGL